MDELENIKVLWQELNQRMESLERDNRMLAREVMNNKYVSAKEKLVKKYTIFSIISFVMIIYGFCFIFYNPFIVEKYKIATCIYWTLFFLFEAFLDLFLSYRLRKIDVYNSNVKEIANLSAQNWKIHKLGIVIGLPLAIGLVILFGLAMNPNEFVIYGMITGGFVGLLIGLIHLRKFYRYYKLLQSERD